MHDCFGKPLSPFCRVRAATKEELEARTPPDRSGPESFSGEKVIVGGNPGATTCNVNLADDSLWPGVIYGGDGGYGIFAFRGSMGCATAHKLVRLD